MKKHTNCRNTRRFTERTAKKTRFSVRRRPRWSYLLILLLYPALSGCTATPDVSSAVPIKSGDRIRLSNEGNTGPLAAGLQSGPAGRAYVFDHDEPDLFVTANRHSLSPGPGLYLYEWLGRNDEGVPVFAPPRKVKLTLINTALKEISDTSPDLTGSVFQTEDGVIHGWWLEGSSIHRTILDRETLQFKPSPEGEIAMTGLPRAPEVPSSLTIMQVGDSEVLIILSINDGVKHRPEGFWRAPDYIMYNGAGVFLGKWTYEYLYISDTIVMDIAAPVRFHQYSTTRKEVLHSFQNMTLVEYEKDNLRLLTGSRFGNLIYYPEAHGRNAGTRVFACDESGIVLRHKAVGPFPISYPNQQTKLASDLIVGGECELIYYPFTNRFSKNGAPIYGTPAPVLQQNADLYPGSLPVVNTIDWDNDGRLDIVAGNSEGRVLLFVNNGTNENPSFSGAQEVEAGGKAIFIQPGYTGSIQGPAESRWGYACPTVTDWNGDGLFDILMHSALSRHEVYLNTGKPGKPVFDCPVPLYCEGLELHGTWRVQPGVKKLDGRMTYVTLDDDDEFHLYRQIDAFNVEDGGKLRMDNDSVIKANFLSAGGTGRLKIVLEDWDRDNRTDMLVGTPRHGSVPDPVTGLPQSRGLKGASVLFLRNVGTNSNPVFAFPVMIRFKGDVIYLGQHACSPEVWDYGQADGPDLLVGEQDGRIRFYDRKDLSWDTEETVPE